MNNSFPALQKCDSDGSQEGHLGRIDLLLMAVEIFSVRIWLLHLPAAYLLPMTTIDHCQPRFELWHHHISLPTCLTLFIFVSIEFSISHLSICLFLSLSLSLCLWYTFHLFLLDFSFFSLSFYLSQSLSLSLSSLFFPSLFQSNSLSLSVVFTTSLFLNHCFVHLCFLTLHNEIYWKN